MRYIPLLFILIACSPQRKLDKAELLIRTHPAIAADICTDLFPIRPASSDSAAYKQSLKTIDSLNIVYQEREMFTARDIDSLTALASHAAHARPDCDTVAASFLSVIGRLNGQVGELQADNKRLVAAARDVKPIRDTIVDDAKVRQYEEQFKECADMGLNLSRELDTKNEQIAGLKKSRNWWRIACIGTWIVVGGGIVLRIMGKLKPI